MEQSEEIYCLKWNQFQINIFAALESLHLSEDFADVTLYCDGSSLKAHKVILSACSPYFKTVFMEHPLCSHPVIILKGVSGEDLNSLLTFMYQGEVNIQRDRLPEFMRTAKLLQVRGLTTSPNPLQKTNTNQQGKKHIYEDSTDSDSSTYGKKRIRIRRRSTDSSVSAGLPLASASLDVVPETNSDETQNEIVNNNKLVEQEVASNTAVYKVNDIKKNVENLNENIDPCNVNQLDIATVTIKQEVSNDNVSETEKEFDSEGSILHRSLKGDHTVKPAESLVVTPDLPIAMNTVKSESLHGANNLSKIQHKNSKSIQQRKTPESLNNQDTHTPDTFEEKLSNTLQVLKNNPQISISREQGEHFQISLKDLKTCNSSGKSKSHTIEIQPQISIEPMRHIDDPEKKRPFIASNSSILAQNLIKTTPPTKYGSPLTCRNIGTDRPPPLTPLKSDANLQIESLTPSALVHILGQPHGSATVVPSVGQSWNCPHCQQLYHNQSALKYHVRLVHSDFNNRLCCYLCPNSFTMRESYKAHMLELHGIRH